MKSPNRFQRKYDFRPPSGFCLNSSPPSVCPLWLLLKYILGILQSLSTVYYAHGYSPNCSKICFYFRCISVLPPCMCVHCMHARCPWRPECQGPWSCEPSRECWEVDSGSLQGQPLLNPFFQNSVPSSICYSSWNISAGSIRVHLVHHSSSKAHN